MTEPAGSDLAALNSSIFDAALAELDVLERKRRYRDDPALWALDMLGHRLWSKQKEIAYSVRDNHNTAVAAAHGGGKSDVASIIMAWWADVHPIDEVKILSTAPTFPQVTGILWDNLRRWHTTAKRRHAEYLRRIEKGIDLGEYRYNDHPLPGRITADNVWKTEDGRQIGVGRKPPDNLLDSAFQGEHAPYLLAIGDEGAGLPAELVDALGNNATGSENRVLLIANPTDPNSRMADFWRTKNPDWVLMNISALDFPTVTSEPGFEDIDLEAKGMSGWNYINEKKRDWGENDPRYISRVLGEWAFDAGNNVFTDEDLAKAANTVVIVDPDSAPRDGWDIARMGGDLTVGYRALEGEVWTTDDMGEPVEPTGRRGLQVRRIDSWSRAPLVGHDPDNLGSATRIDDYALGAATNIVVIDSTGVGSGVVDGLRELGFGKAKYQVIEYYGAGASTDRRAFVNARAEHFFALKDMMFAEQIDLDPADDMVFDELRGIVFDFSTNGARKIESKADMKRRGVKSPDFADAVVYASYDISPLVDDPLRQYERGQALFYPASAWEELEMSRLSDDYPV